MHRGPACLGARDPPAGQRVQQPAQRPLAPAVPDCLPRPLRLPVAPSACSAPVGTTPPSTILKAWPAAHLPAASLAARRRPPPALPQQWTATRRCLTRWPGCCAARHGSTSRCGGRVGNSPGEAAVPPVLSTSRGVHRIRHPLPALAAAPPLLVCFGDNVLRRTAHPGGNKRAPTPPFAVCSCQTC